MIDVEREVGQPIERLLSARGLFHHESVIGQLFRNSFPERLLVVNDQQMFRGVRHLVGWAVF